MNDRVTGYMVTYNKCDQERSDVTMTLGSNDQGRLDESRIFSNQVEREIP